ncbi:MAG: hypothetical protein HHJ11_00500 [Phycicoccus sp.]|nr:hypothetical protein [Phycicoccus sp.]
MTFTAAIEVTLCGFSGMFEMSEMPLEEFGWRPRAWAQSSLAMGTGVELLRRASDGRFARVAAPDDDDHALVRRSVTGSLVAPSVGPSASAANKHRRWMPAAARFRFSMDVTRRCTTNREEPEEATSRWLIGCVSAG